jgi:hypothetical protein
MNSYLRLQKKSDYLVHRMKEIGILMCADGPIKTSSKENADGVLFYLQKVLAEEGMKTG